MITVNGKSIEEFLDKQQSIEILTDLQEANKQHYLYKRSKQRIKTYYRSGKPKIINHESILDYIINTLPANFLARYKSLTDCQKTVISNLWDTSYICNIPDAQTFLIKLIKKMA